MNTFRQKHSIAGGFIFLLLGLFALMSTVLVVFGARAYQNAARQAQEHNEQRILSSYIRSMIRQMDEEDTVKVENLQGMDIVTLEENYDGMIYRTRIYCCDGWLRDWFAGENAEFLPETGEPIIAASAMEAELQGGRLSVKLTGEDPGLEVLVETAVFCSGGEGRSSS